MLKKNLTLPTNADPLLPSQHRTALDLYIAENIDSLAGVDPFIASRLSKRANMNSLQYQNRYDGDPVLVSDYLRVRKDETLALHPVVSQAVRERHHDQLLEDLVSTYHERLAGEHSTSSGLEPVPGFPEPALDGLNAGYDLGYLHPEFELAPAVDKDCDGRHIRPASDYPIQTHDILADLRAEGIVTNLAKSGCDVCGHEAGRELADRLRDDDYTVAGYAGIAAESHPEDLMVSVQAFSWSTLETTDVVDLVVDTAENHGFRSNVRVEKAGILRC